MFNRHVINKEVFVPKPYIGVTGFTFKTEVCVALAAFLPTSRHLLMVGVLASGKTIEGEQNKWPARYPLAANLGSVFVDDPRALNLIHFNTKELATLEVQLAKARELAGPLCHGFQLNIAWPDPKVLVQLRKQEKPPVIVLQIGARALELMNYSAKRLARQVAHDYTGLIDYVLLDPSGGAGSLLNPAQAVDCLRALEDRQIPQLGLGVAGGLCGLTIPGVLPAIADQFPDVSIDAEGRLRDDEDRLSLQEVVRYIETAETVLK